MFDVGLFLAITFAFFSTIGIVCIGLGTYSVLRNELHDKTEKKKENKFHDRTLIGN